MQHDHLNAAFGFGLFPLPAYRPASRGDWRIRLHLPALGDGYLGTAAVESRAVLSRGREVWMSTGLLERESHAWHVHCARGVVVAAGLGMGLYAYAAAMKQAVDLVVVAEISSEIAAVMREGTGFDDWPCRDKIRLLETDALAPGFAEQVRRCTAGRPVDYLYADIWPRYPDPDAPEQTASMAHALRVRAAGFWGQELSFAHFCRRTGIGADEDALRLFFGAVDIPAPPITAGYASFCRAAMRAHRAGTSSVWRRIGTMLKRPG